MKIIQTIIFLTIASVLRGQSDSLRLSLVQVVEMAKNNSIAAKQAATTKETRMWEYRNFQSNYKPQLLLNSRLPAFNRSFREVVQPDGTIQFQPIRNNNSSVGVSLEQNIAATGGTVFAQTQLQRFDDFDRQNTLYNGTLFAVGLAQPLFRFNNLKWDKKIEPLKYNESQQEYLEAFELIALKANELYFGLLLAEVNLSIATTNSTNTDKIMAITKEKLDIGKVSRNEILQLELEQLKAQKAVASANQEMEIANLKLRSFIGLQTNEKLKLDEPLPTGFERNNSQLKAQNSKLTTPSVSKDILLKEAFENRADAVGFVRRKLEAERVVAKAKGDNGLNATLNANLGFSNRGTKIGEVVKQPQNYQAIEIQFDMPILDWGRQQARIKTAEANRTLTQQTIEQDKEVFRQEIITQITLFEMLKSQLTLTAKADAIASEKYQIAQDRYVLGNLSITDLSIAFAEKDQAKRDFVGALRDYWAAYYRLRWLTLYDFERGVKIR
jgi:outer membrane protein